MQIDDKVVTTSIIGIAVSIISFIGYMAWENSSRISGLEVKDQLILDNQQQLNDKIDLVIDKLADNN